MAPLKIELTKAALALGEGQGKSVPMFDAHDASVLLFAPGENDDQTPHSRDEFYIVVSGRGTFKRGSELVRFVPGDVLFVPAHTPHRFESYSADFKTWVIFYGPRTDAKPG